MARNQSEALRSSESTPLLFSERLENVAPGSILRQKIKVCGLISTSTSSPTQQDEAPVPRRAARAFKLFFALQFLCCVVFRVTVTLCVTVNVFD